MQRLGSGEKRKRVTFIAHSGQQEIKARILSVFQLEKFAQSFFVFEGGLSGVGIFAFDARDLLRLERRFGNHGFGSHAKIAFGMVRGDVALVAEEQMSFIPGNL